MNIKIGRDRIKWKGKFNRVIERDFVGVDGKKGVWEILQRNTEGNVAIVVPVTDDGKVLFITHFRIPRKEYVLECPAGLFDKKGEKSIEVARRELLEETGYRAKKMTLFARGANNGGLMNENYLFFIATGCKKVAEPQCESAEDIGIIEVPLEQVEDFLWLQREGAVAAPIYGVPYFLRRLGLIE